MACLSSGKDAALSRQNQGFDSPTGYQLRKDIFMKVWLLKKFDYEDSYNIGIYTEEGKKKFLEILYETVKQDDEKTLQLCNERIKQLIEERKVFHKDSEELLKEERLAKENGNREKMLSIRKKRRATLRIEEEYTHKIRIIEYEKNDILKGSKEGRINHYLDQNNLNFYEYELDSNFNLIPEYLWLD